MHLLIPFAFCNSEGCRQVLPTLKLPHLEKLLRRLSAEPLDAGSEASLSAPHERALARALDLPVEDGLIPLAAWQAQALQAAPAGAAAWAFITPCHWQAGTKQVAMSTTLSQFSAPASQTLLVAMQPYFEEDGITLYYDQPDRWLACGAAFKGLATASLDRVAGRSVAHWLPNTPGAIPLQRLQSEMQMLLYNHPVNDARAAQGLATVNSFWISGTGALAPARCRPATELAPPTLVATLRTAALSEDWAAWAQAWQALDSTECAALLSALARGESSQLTLCGERNAQTFKVQSRSLLNRIRHLLDSDRAATVLEQL